MTEASGPQSSYFIELIEYGYRKSLLEVNGATEFDATERIDSFDPAGVPAEGIVVIESVFEATDSEIMSIELSD
jgi:hypothetical protein